MGRRVGPRAWYEEKWEAARRKLYNEDAEGPGGLQCYITGRVVGRKALTPGWGRGRGDGQAGDPPNKELGHLEVREWAMAQKWGKGRNLGLVHSFIGSFIQ